MASEKLIDATPDELAVQEPYSAWWKQNWPRISDGVSDWTLAHQAFSAGAKYARNIALVDAGEVNADHESCKKTCDTLRDIISRMQSDAGEVRGDLQKLVDEQAEDDGLWFQARYVSEAYLQAALRKLHSAIEALPAAPGHAQGETMRDVNMTTFIHPDGSTLTLNESELAAIGPPPGATEWHPEKPDTIPVPADVWKQVLNSLMWMIAGYAGALDEVEASNNHPGRDRVIEARQVYSTAAKSVGVGS